MVVERNRTVQATESFTAFAQAVVVAWQSSDLSSYTPASAPILNLTSLYLDPTSSTSAALHHEQSQTSGLTTGAKAGIGAGVAGGVLLGCTLLGWALYQRSRRAKNEALTRLSLTETSVATNERKAELGSDGQIQEIGGRSVTAEADYTNTRYELEGNWHGHETSGLEGST